ncbi:helicase-related protein [Emergencia timonensis]|uniref:preprotein translocase subunit SecA n=1 Tax=Emergencia timonensis TaxID=1776384 RepID=UPI003993DFE1
MKRIYKKFLSKVHSYSWDTFDVHELSVRLRQAEPSDLPLLYSLIIKIIKRMTGFTLFDSQIVAAYAMQSGKIAQLPTGEGKTLAAVLVAAASALQGRHVHIFTVNDYLAIRDYETSCEIFCRCGLTSSCIIERSSLSDKKKAYESEILYITAKQAGFDYLRNFLCMDRCDYLRNPFDMVLIDEADSILIDEAAIPLVIAADSTASQQFAVQADSFVRDLDEESLDFAALSLTESGINRAEAFFQVDNLYALENIELLTAINDALEAHYRLRKNVDYIIKDRQILVVDQTTGRTPKNRRFPAQLHLAVELKEHLQPGQITTVCNSMPLRFFVMQYDKICGMTGTAEDAEKSLALSYGLKVEIIPPHLPCVRKDLPDQIFDTDAARDLAILRQITACHSKGQPVLVGTQSVEESEKLSLLLREKNIPCQVLNACNDEQEAAIIADAGRAFAVTVSTNMAGRGVDIKLDDNARAAGGLSVMGLGINESRRIDKQLAGRSGRQGDPGMSRFFISLEDSRLKAVSATNPRHAQRILEGKNAEYRYLLDKYSHVQELHRQQITEYRENLLFAQPSMPQAAALHCINEHWSDYLQAMENIRNSIHLVILGGLDPIDEYNKAAAKAYEEMMLDIEKDIAVFKETPCPDIFGRPAATYSYQIDESRSQFAKSRKSR